MQSIKETKAFHAIQPKVLEEFICADCGEKVKRTELTIPIGPRKGEKIIADYDCICSKKEFAETIAKEAKERRNKLRSDKMLKHFDGHSLLNKSLISATFENYEATNNDQRSAKQIAMKYTADFNGTGNLLFSGSYGTGKSHLSVAITKALMEKGKTCVFISFPKLLTKIKDTYNNDGPTEDQLMSAMKNVDLLVIDDIGAEHKTPWTTPKLFEIIDDRAGKATIYTTNLNSKELKGWVGERNFSRVMENTDPIQLNGNDYRRKEF
ncbi:ATP-binding protein [Paraliobacillus sediminis]|uniref:ATP-binding protein n=1 Tax=Paraliobacillus sediminis TaxID=1885916 RepID=UPI000E3DEA11|nr:ATP-binding protein [Paraliobacillus sediminis]